MKSMGKKFLYLVFLLTIFSLESYSQSFYIVVKGIDRSDDFIFYENKTTWIVLTPYAWASRKFSPDYGDNWYRTGVFGQNIRPYIHNNKEAEKNLNIYAALKVAGITQMFVIAPTILITGLNGAEERYQSNSDVQNEGFPSFLSQFFIVLYTGAITNHFIAETFLKRALRQYYFDKDGILGSRKFKPNFGFSLDKMTLNPVLTLTWKI
jgi:hypothetical protein